MATKQTTDFSIYNELTDLSFNCIYTACGELRDGIHFIGGGGSSSGSTTHKILKGPGDVGTFSNGTAYPFAMTRAASVFIKREDGSEAPDEIYIIGSYSPSNARKMVYKLYVNPPGGTTVYSWFQLPSLPYDFYDGAAVYYNNKIYIFGGQSSGRKWSIFDGTSWTEQSSQLPGYMTNVKAIVYKNLVYLFYSASNYYTFDGTSFTLHSLPSGVSFSGGKGSLIIKDDKLHVFGASKTSGGTNYNLHLIFDGDSWVTEINDMPFKFTSGCTAIYNNEINIFGSDYKYRLRYQCYNLEYTGINDVVYGDDNLLDLSKDTISRTKDLVEGVVAHDRRGVPILGTRRKYYEVYSDYISKYSPSYSAMSEGDMGGPYLGDQQILIRNPSSNKGYIQLVSTIYSSGAESIINLVTGLSADLIYTFTILRTIYVDKRTCIIVYTWDTAASQAVGERSTTQARMIHLKRDGSLYQYTAYQIGVNFATNYNHLDNCILVPMLYNNIGAEMVAFCRFFRNSTNGNQDIYYRLAYIQMRVSTVDTCAIVFAGNGLSTLASNSTNTRCSWPGNDIRIRGGLFYVNTSSVPCLFLINNYYGSSSYIMSGAVTTFADTSSEHIEKLKVSLPNFATYEDEPDVDGRHLAVMGLLEDQSTLVILRCEITSNGAYNHEQVVYLDFWDLNLPAKWLTYINSIELTDRNHYHFPQDWSEVTGIKFAYLDGNIFYYMDYNNEHKRIQINNTRPWEYVDLSPLKGVKNGGFGDPVGSHTNFQSDIALLD